MSIVYILKEGHAWNPLLKIPRNMKCPCGSDKKYKLCHLPTMPRAVPEKLAAEYRAAMKHVEYAQFIGDTKGENQVTDIGREEDSSGQV